METQATTIYAAKCDRLCAELKALASKLTVDGGYSNRSRGDAAAIHADGLSLAAKALDAWLSDIIGACEFETGALRGNDINGRTVEYSSLVTDALTQSTDILHDFASFGERLFEHGEAA